LKEAENISKIFFDARNKSKRKPVKQSLRTRLIIRCKGRCERCGKPLNGIAPHIHHEDGNPENNKPSNLLVLCLNCHGKTGTYKKPKHKKELSPYEKIMRL
jgi:5-methylcytosine-specific restriction endonuclease McrA